MALLKLFLILLRQLLVLHVYVMISNVGNTAAEGRPLASHMNLCTLLTKKGDIATLLEYPQSPLFNLAEGVSFPDVRWSGEFGTWRPTHESKVPVTLSHLDTLSNCCSLRLRAPEFFKFVSSSAGFPSNVM